MRFSSWLQARLVAEDSKGTQWPPGGGVGRRWKEPNGVEVAFIAQGETMDLYVGRLEFMNVSLSGRTLVRVAVWLLIWWCWNCWFGLRLRAWRWTLGRQYDRNLDEEAPGSLGGPRAAP